MATVWQLCGLLTFSIYSCVIIRTLSLPHSLALSLWGPTESAVAALEPEDDDACTQDSRRLFIRSAFAF